MVETLSVVFKKNDGKTFFMPIPYPKKPVSQEAVKELVQYVIEQNVFEFKDGAKITGLKEVVLLSRNEQPVEVTLP